MEPLIFKNHVVNNPAVWLGPAVNLERRKETELMKKLGITRKRFKKLTKKARKVNKNEAV